MTKSQLPTTSEVDHLTTLPPELLNRIFSELSSNEIRQLRNINRFIKILIDANIAAILRPTILFHQKRLRTDYNMLSNTGGLLPSEVFRRFLCYYGEMEESASVRRDVLTRLFGTYTCARYKDVDTTGFRFGPFEHPLQWIAKTMAAAANWVLEVAASKRREPALWDLTREQSPNRKFEFSMLRVDVEEDFDTSAELLKDDSLKETVDSMQDVLATAPLRSSRAQYRITFPNETHRWTQLAPSDPVSQEVMVEPLTTSLGVPSLSNGFFSYCAGSAKIGALVLRAYASEVTELEKTVILEDMFIW